MRDLPLPFSTSFSFIKKNTRASKKSSLSTIPSAPVVCVTSFDDALYTQQAETRKRILRDVIAQTESGANDLTQAEMAFVKHIWNKQLAWHELTMDTFVKRLLYIQPNVAYLACHSALALEMEFFGYFDLCVRSIQPDTENIARESYRSVHPDPQRRYVMCVMCGGCCVKMW